MNKLFGILVLLVSISGCQETGDESVSDAKTIDELAGGSDSAKSEGCYGLASKASFIEAYPELQDAYSTQVVAPDSVRSEVERTLSAIPNGLKSVFFGMGAELHFVADLKSACSQGSQASGTSSAVLSNNNFSSCSRVVPVTNADNSSAEKTILIVQADPKNFKSNLVLSMMGFVSRKLGKIEAESSGNLVSRDDESEKVRKFKTNFALNVLHEGFSSSQNDFSLLKDVLPKNAKFSSKETSLSERAKIFAEFSKRDPEAAGFLLADVFDNGADSFYCNEKTNASFKRKYPASYKLWSGQIHSDFKGKSSLNLVDEGESEDVGFGLAWGAGPGRPFGGFFANRVAKTGVAFPRLHGLRRPLDGSGSWVQPPAWGSGQRLGWRFRR